LKGIAIDPATGYIYFTGSTNSTNLLGAGAFQTTSQGGLDAFLAVLDPTQLQGPSLIYATYFGGTGTDDARSIAVFNGMAYITGQTDSGNFPTKNAIQSTPVGGVEIFVAEFDASKTGTNSLVSSTYIVGGANDYGRAIAIDNQGKVYVAGISYSPSMPVTPDAYQQFSSDGGDAFLLKLDLAAQTVLYGTYLEGTKYDEVKRIVVEPSGRVGLVGLTSSPDFPTTANAFQTQLNGTVNAFLTILDPSKPGPDGLAYSTYFGASSGEVAYDVARDITGKYYLGGYTLSADLPITSDALNQETGLGGTDGFFAVIDPSVSGVPSLIYSTYLTSKGNQVVYGVDVDLTNTAYVVGTATADIFPAGQAIRTSKPGNTDGFFLVLKFPPPPQALTNAFKGATKTKPASAPGTGSTAPRQGTVPAEQPRTNNNLRRSLEN